MNLLFISVKNKLLCTFRYQSNIQTIKNSINGNEVIRSYPNQKISQLIPAPPNKTALSIFIYVFY